MNDLDVIGENIWFDGHKIGSLRKLPASTAQRARETLLGELSEEQTQKEYDRGYDDGYDAANRDIGDGT